MAVAFRAAPAPCSPPGLRLSAWVLVIVVWIVGIAVLDWRGGALRDTSLGAGSSMIERFDLFTIIVLGEVIVGVVTGIAAAGRSRAAVVTGVLGLGIGFAYWWSYFDLVAARRLASRRGALATWVLGHFPVTLTIAASGAVMVSMIDHADTGHAPYPASLLLSSSVAVGILALIPIATSLADWRDLAPTMQPCMPAGFAPSSCSPCTRWRWPGSASTPATGATPGDGCSAQPSSSRMTTFGPADGAQRVLDRINKVHGTVSGTAPDGRRYDARDPHLLAWVHIDEIDSFLTAYQRTARTPMTPTEADTYVSQTSWVATELGVPNPPRSVAELSATLASYRPELQVTDGARDAAAFLLREPPLPRAARPGYWMLAAGAVAMLPGYAQDLLGLRLPGALDGIADTLVLQPLGRLGTAAAGWALAEPGDVRNTPQSSAVSG